MKRNISIDILKCFAVFLITNSHMDRLYHPYEWMATGGAIGDVLFFFCSGFTLFLGSTSRFDFWYKRRINRIYPSIFALALYSSLFFNKSYNIPDLLINGGGWFIGCIMIYYVFIFFIKKYALHKIPLIFGIVSIIIICWYLFENRSTIFMYGDTWFKWIHYFLFMLLGASMGISTKKQKFFLPKDFTLLILNIVLYYSILFTGDKYTFFAQFQIISLIPLLFITYYFYKVCNSNLLLKLMQTRIIGWIINTISILTLEIYLVQNTLFTDKMNGIFPFNIPVMFIFIVIVAYFIKILARLFSQTFNGKKYLKYNAK